MTTIAFQGKPLNTSGELPQVGTDAPPFTLTSRELVDVTLANYTGKRKILNIVPSLDTPTCAASTRKFNQKASHLDNTVVLAISADLPFAQSRFCESEGLKDVTPLSTFRSNFANEYGIAIVDTFLRGLTARAIVIIDEHDKVIYTQLVKEIVDEPDYESALAVLSD